jgi:hypothetical protein
MHNSFTVGGTPDNSTHQNRFGERLPGLYFVETTVSLRSPPTASLRVLRYAGQLVPGTAEMKDDEVVDCLSEVQSYLDEIAKVPAGSEKGVRRIVALYTQARRVRPLWRDFDYTLVCLWALQRRA